MKAVGDLIRFCSYERGLGFIDRKIEIMRGNAFKLLGEELFHLGEDVFNKGFAPADDILIETGLGFVNAQ